MRPAIRRVTVRIKELYDAKEQEFFGALSGACSATTRPSWSTTTPCPWSTPTTASGWPGSSPRPPCALG
jgi:hypothetical protein